MTILSIINLKGGVGKTISSITMAYIMAVILGLRVLLIDNDKQACTSRFFGRHDYNVPCIADVLSIKGFGIRKAIRKSSFPNLDILPANMTLLRADKEILMDCSRPQQTRLKKALQEVADEYDYVIIDNAPDINMSTINALVASNDVLIPLKIDNFSFDGVDQILELIEEIREFNEPIRVIGGFITMYQNSKVASMGRTLLSSSKKLPLFDTVIRKTVAIDETTFSRNPITKHKKNSTAAQDYTQLMDEYLHKSGRHS